MKGAFEKGEHPLRERELILTYHYRRESRNINGYKSIAQSSGLLLAISCPKEMDGKENEVKSKRRQKQTRNG